MPRASPKRTARKRNYHHGDLHRALVSTALELVEANDVSALTLREVARRAGVTHGAPYHHFRNKAALLAALAEEGYRALYTEQLQAVAKAGPDPIARLHAIGIAYVRFAVQHPGHFRVMFGTDTADWSDYPSLLEAVQLPLVLLTSTAEEIKRSKRLSLKPSDFVLSSWAMVHGLATLWVDGPLRPILGSTDASAIEELAARIIPFWTVVLQPDAKQVAK
ncbi:MAG TPA: TetR/AcrR family transcriptional regulator [Polyangiaceae bacterium]|nr:TetR/AcrR family transcriptional regulator [Polyangiaceae bacterium]